MQSVNPANVNPLLITARGAGLPTLPTGPFKDVDELNGLLVSSGSRFGVAGAFGAAGSLGPKSRVFSILTEEDQNNPSDSPLPAEFYLLRPINFGKSTMLEPVKAADISFSEFTTAAPIVDGASGGLSEPAYATAVSVTENGLLLNQTGWALRARGGTPATVTLWEPGPYLGWLFLMQCPEDTIQKAALCEQSYGESC